jgi:hypothetical protein
MNSQSGPALADLADDGRAANASPELASPELARFGAGLALSGLYGLALGARGSGAELVRHAFGAPLCLVILAALLTPSLSVLLALFQAPLTPWQLFAKIARSLATAALVFAGLAPATALFVVTIAAGDLVSSVARAGAGLAGGLALAQLFTALWTVLADAPALTRYKARAFLVGYSLFIVLLGARLFATLLPLMGGAS